ncbi:MAG: hypothetical protein ACD_75C00608G0002 [uncultured bacterium]|nr:MAG: hypothetical protein ACD_75C00608G0002 [uncultured bacterium]HBG19769.1 hypothetical protein [Desulfobulbaceae bacterium]
MISYLTICLASLVTSGLTLYSGFGLGTLLMPVFALFFPVETAVAATAIVHGANNLFKIGMVGRCADRSLVLKFGVPAVVAALAGAAALGFISQFSEITRYFIGSQTAVVTPIKLIMAVLMSIFAMFELLPHLRELRFDRKYLFVGGLLSGFFGGFSGHQGALRSAFLVKVDISTEAFVGTNAVIGCMVDMTRIATYAALFFAVSSENIFGTEHWSLIAAGTVSAFLGVMISKRYLAKIAMKTVQTLTGYLLLGIALALGAGLI